MVVQRDFFVMPHDELVGADARLERGDVALGREERKTDARSDRPEEIRRRSRDRDVRKENHDEELRRREHSPEAQHRLHSIGLDEALLVRHERRAARLPHVEHVEEREALTVSLRGGRA